MAIEYREYRAYKSAALHLLAMGSSMQEAWKQINSHLSDVMTTQGLFATDADEKAKIINELTTRVDGFDTMLSAYGEALHTKMLTKLVEKLGE